MQKMGILIVVKIVEMYFKLPVYLDDELTVTCIPITAKGVCVTFEQKIICSEKKLVHLIVKIVSINSDGILVRLPVGY